MYAVILAGGGGTRLWPLSDPAHPKPFLPLFDDGSLLQKTVHRLTAGAELGLTETDLTVVTDRLYERLVRDQVPGVAVLSEPMGRNTAAAIALATLTVDRPDDEVMVVLPADHLVTDEAGFRAVLSAAAALADGAFGVEAPIVTLGAQPTGPSTQYGYLVPEFQRGTTGSLTAYPLERFEEKPNSDRAEGLLRMPGVAWNAGIFIAKRRAFLDALGRYTELLDQLAPGVTDAAALPAAYEEVEPISIDYAVMEPASLGKGKAHVVVVEMPVQWLDVGSWPALAETLSTDEHNNAHDCKACVFVDCDDNIVVSEDPEHLVALVGISDMIVVHTKDATLVCPKREAQRVKELVGKVKEKYGDRYQ